MADRPLREVTASDPGFRAAVEPAWKRPVPPLEPISARPSVKDLVQIIGVDATTQLCAQLGGTTREVGLGPSKAFVEAIGLEAAVKLRDAWGKGRLHVPRRPNTAGERRELVHKLAAAGKTRQAIAQLVGLGERQVYHILARAQPVAAALLAVFIAFP